MTKMDHELPTISRRGRSEISQSIQDRLPEDRTSGAPFAGRLALRIPEAAAAIGLGKSSLYQLIADDKVKSCVIAGRRVVPVSELERLLRAAVSTDAKPIKGKGGHHTTKPRGHD